MENQESKSKEKNNYPFPKKKYLNEEENKNDLDGNFVISTNLTYLKLNKDAIKGVYLFGCDIEEENQILSDLNQVNIMRKARKQKCFQERIKKYVPDYYISGLILMGKPISEKKKFKFYLRIKEENEGNEGKIVESEILDELPENGNLNGNIYRFKFKKNKKDLSEMDKEKDSGEAQCVANYLNICLGKLLKKCGYTKDRSTRKILYYNKNEAKNAQEIDNKSSFVYFPALKAVCEAYDGGNIFMKLLPKKLLKTKYTYADYFNSIEANDLNEVIEIFKNKVINKKGIKIYDQGFIKIEDVIYEDPYKIIFLDKNSKEMSVGEYYNDVKKIKLQRGEKIPIAVRIVDKGGKLKGKDVLYIHIPCFLLEVIGNIFGENINVKKLVQSPFEKLDEINYIREIMEKAKKNVNEDQLHNYLGDKFEPLTLNGQIIKPPLIQFENNHQVTTNKGSFNFVKSSPYSKIKELKKVDIYLLDLSNDKGEFIWEKLKQASKELGISFKEEPTFYPIDNYNDQSKFQSYILDYFKKVDNYYSDKTNETDFIFMFMDSRKKTTFHYRIFKSTINTFNWVIPTQVILFDENKFYRKTNLSQFTNILCQMWAKKGNELYICDFNFVPKTMVIAYSSMAINENNVLTSVSISIGTKRIYVLLKNRRKYK